jgi:hypothetical protein
MSDSTGWTARISEEIFPQSNPDHSGLRRSLSWLFRYTESDDSDDDNH